MWKRISAALLDLILVAMVAVGMAFLLSTIFGFDGQMNLVERYEAEYESEYNVNFDIEREDYDQLTEDEQKVYDDAYAAFRLNEDVRRAYNTMNSLIMLIITFGLLLAFLIMELAVPLILGNGQTLGKKIFGIGVVREDGIRLSPMLLFIRTILGKYTVETMLPVFILIMMVFGLMNIAGLIAIVALLILQVVLLIATPTRTPLHDKLAHTVTVDFASQRIFDSLEEKAAYYKRIHEERLHDDGSDR